MNTYDEDNVPQEGDNEPASVGSQGDTGGMGDVQSKVAQPQARYRRGSPVQHCGVCMMFGKPEDDGNTGTCTKVDGTISPYGLCDYYAETKNPFGPILGPQERSAIDEMSQSGPDQSRFAQAPQGPSPIQQGMGGGMPSVGGQPAPAPMRIGRQSY